MTERRRPLENDDGQGALFGGEAFAPAGPAPAWKRPADSASPAAEAAASAPFEARVEDDAPGAPDPSARRDADDAEADVAASRGLEPGADASPHVAAGPEADVTAPSAFEASAGTAPHAAAGAGADVPAPRGFEPGAGADPTDAPVRGAAAPTSPSPFADEIAALERATEGHAPRRPRAPLAGPTLDDVMSRVWEGLVTGLPAACPVCHGEVVPALTGPPHGRCSSCGTAID